MEKFKLPELKVTSFVTSLDDQTMSQIHGGVDSGICGISHGVCGTESACSSSDLNQGVSCTGTCAA